MRTALAFVLALLLSACAAPSETPFEPTEAPHQDLVPVPTQDLSLVPALTLLPDGGVSLYTSPDGIWIAESYFTFTPDGTLSRLTLRAADGSAEWAYENQQGQGLGFTVPQPLRWDGDLLYFSEVAQPDGCAPGFNNGGNLLAMNLGTGEVETLIEGSGWWISLSPDLTQAAILPFGPGQKLVVRGVHTAEQMAVALPAEAEGLDAGAIVWSPDGMKLALTLATNPCFGAAGQVHHIVLADLQAGSIGVIYTDETAGYVTESWPEAGYIVLRSASGEGRWLDAATGELIPLP